MIKKGQTYYKKTNKLVRMVVTDVTNDSITYHEIEYPAIRIRNEVDFLRVFELEKNVQILNNSEFEETINSPKRIARVLTEIKTEKFEINNGQIVVNYSDEGFACFEIILNIETNLVLSFLSTAS